MNAQAFVFCLYVVGSICFLVGSLISLFGAWK